MRNDKELQRAVLAVMLGQKQEPVEEAKKSLTPNQQKLDVHEPEKDELTAKDFEMLRAGKKAKNNEDEVKEETEQVDEARFKKGEDIGKPGKNFAKIAKAAAAKYGSKEAGQRVAGAVLKKVLAKEEIELDDEIEETIFVHAPVEFEVKESYNFGDYLTAAKKLVGEDEAINLANEKFKTQDISIFAEEYMRSDIEDRVNTWAKAGHKVSLPKYSTKSGKPYAEYVVTDKDTGARRKYIYHGNTRSVEHMGTAGKKDE